MRTCPGLSWIFVRLCPPNCILMFHTRNQSPHPPLSHAHLSRPQLNLHEFVSCLLKVEAAHDGEVDGAAQVDHISARLILNVTRITTTTASMLPSLTVVI